MPGSEKSGAKGLIWRAARPADIAILADFFQESAEIDGSQNTVSSESLKNLFSLLGESSSTNTRIAIGPDGLAVAFAFTYFPATGSGKEDLGHFDFDIHARERQSEAGQAIFKWLAQRCSEQLKKMDEDRFLRMMIGCKPESSYKIELVRLHGYRPSRYSYRMKRDLADKLPDHSFPKELQLSPWSPKIDDKMRVAFNEAFNGSFGVPQMDQALWKRRFIKTAKFRGDLSFAVISGEQVVGFCLNEVEPTSREHQGQAAFVEAIGVVPAFRGRGIAAAMLSHALRLFKQEGFQATLLDVDAQNPTGALQLYEKLGFRQAESKVYYSKLMGSAN